MKRVGLVDQLEVELEQMISKGWLPADGRLPSERTLAELRGVSRSTAREALVRLKSRGLVVRHPGRLSRALPLDESLTLENLGVALHGNDSEHPERHGLLVGYFALKRELTPNWSDFRTSSFQPPPPGAPRASPLRQPFRSCDDVLYSSKEPGDAGHP